MSERNKLNTARIFHSTAFSPGHITGFFEPFISEGNPLSCGSRGAGLCISLGAKSTVCVIISDDVEDKRGIVNNAATAKRLKCYINGVLSYAPVTRKAIELLLENKLSRCNRRRRYRIKDIIVSTNLDLPVSQGFGMSGAGALSASLAFADILNKITGSRIRHLDAAAAAHTAEVTSRTGLGDVVAQTAGGWEFRLKPGFPPFGKLVQPQIGYKKTIIISTVGKEIKTKNTLSDERKREWIKTVGAGCIKEFQRRQSLDIFFKISNEFTLETGLRTPETDEVLKKLNKYGFAAQSMLGNSVFAVGDVGEMTDIMRKYGRVYICEFGDRAAVVNRCNNIKP